MTHLNPLRRPELLAPAGSWDCARAAAANGADAIYFGLGAFNARLRADNFSEADLPDLMQFLHGQEMRGYLTLNTLIFPSELAEAERLLRIAEQARVDAVLVQDLGLARLARAVAPGLELHASTQMTITSPEGMRFARSLGVDRVVVARELSLKELAKFRQDDPELVPLEAFVHGALCVAYSGQCLTSESLGQRSANRGECAQACRLPYDLVVDGQTLDLGDKRYLLSPQDLAAVDDVPALLRAGLSSFKIEGRLKTPEYVAAVTQVYRRAIDAALATETPAPVSARERYHLEMAFSRGLFSGWLHGVDHQRLVHARYGTKRGAFVGSVCRVGEDWVEVELEAPLQAGDGVAFDTGGNPDHEQGGRVYQVAPAPRHASSARDLPLARLSFQHGRIDFRRLSAGHRVWKTSDPELERELQKTFRNPLPPKRWPLRVRVGGKLGESLWLEGHVMSTGASHPRPWARVHSTIALNQARARALSVDVLREHLGRLGDTRFSLAELEVELSDDLFLPLRELNETRRALVSALETEMDQGLEREPSGNEPRASGLAALLAGVEARRAGDQAGAVPEAFQRPSTQPMLTVLCRTLEQVQATLARGVQTLYVDFEDLRRYPDAVACVRAHAAAAPGMSPARVLLATPRIQKAGEQGFFRIIEAALPDGVLIRNLGAMSYFKESQLEKIGDFSLNVANALSAELLIDAGLDVVTVAYDLNHRQVRDLLLSSPPSWFELTLHQHMPLFHMEHCVFAAFLSAGHTHLDCGRPCEHHSVRLRDRRGAEHPVQVDVGCRNTVYHESAQSGARHLQSFMELGLSRVRLELVDEGAERATQLIASYQALLNGQVTPQALLTELRLKSQLGVTEGTLAVLR